jgi:hypothetical protein
VHQFATLTAETTGITEKIQKFSLGVLGGQRQRLVLRKFCWWRCLLGLLICLGAPASVALAAPSPDARSAIRGVVFDESLDRDSVLLPALPRSGPELPPLMVRLALNAGAKPAAPPQTIFANLDRRLAAYAGSHVAIVIDLGGFPEADDQLDAWPQWLRLVAEHAKGRVAAYQIGAIASAAQATEPVDRHLFLLKLASVQLRAADSDALILDGPLPASFDRWLGRLYAAGAAPYIDGVSLAAADDAFRDGAGRMTDIVERENPRGVVLLGPVVLPDDAEAAGRRFAEMQMRSLGTIVHAVSYTGGARAVRAALAVAARAADLHASALVPLDERASRLRLTRSGVDVTASVPHRLLFSTSNFATFLIYGGVAGVQPIEVEASVAGATTPQVRDLVSGAIAKPSRGEAAAGTAMRLTVPVAAYPLVLDFNAGAAALVTESAEVRTEVLPGIDEIIARHQQAQAAQDGVLSRYVAHMRLEQHFRPSPAEPAWNIVTENRLFVEGASVEWEELSFALNGATWTSNRPPFPLVQPEKVLSLPLDLRLSRDYTYRLTGLDTVNGRRAFVVRFEPATSGRALYRGTVWIDRELYVRLKVQAVESNLTGMVVSNDETETYGKAGDVEGRPIWLLERLSSQQMFLIAGRTVLVEREAHLSDIVLNPAAFDSDRAAARAGNRIMYRDTDQGLRYLVKRGDTRVVSNDLTTSTRAFALGVQVDPSFDYPLPIGGLDVLDFNFLDRNLQFALLFAGVFGAGNLQRPNLWGGRFDASVDFFYLAVKSNDSLFDARGELTESRVRRLPASAGVNLGFQATPFQKVAGHYEFKYDNYSRDPLAAPDFTPPSSTGTHGLGVSYEYRRGGYSVIGNAMTHHRTNADPWGPAGDVQAPPRSFATFDVGLSKDFIFATFHTIHLNGALFSGDQLDRFSMYQFGLFDPARMHGVPSAVRFAELAMLRASYSFNLFNQYRVDLFADHAHGRGAESGDPWQRVTGVGLGLNLRTPHDTILRADLGKSFLPESYRGAGSVTLQIMLLKPL